MSEPIPGLPRSYTLTRQQGSEQLARVDGGAQPAVSGPCIVSASWSGPQKAELWHRHNTGNGRSWRKLAEFNGGGEPLSESGQNQANRSWFMYVLRRLRRMWRTITGAPSRSTISDRRGGGVGGRRKRGLWRVAGDQVVRSGDRGWERESDRRGKFLPRSVGGRFHHYSQRGAVEPGRTLSDHWVGVGALRVAGNIGGADACAVERGRAERRNTLPARQGERSLRRGSDCNHVPAGVAAGGGGFVNEHPCFYAGGHYVFDPGQRQWRVLPSWFRLLPAALHRGADDFGDGAQRLRLDSSIDGSELQNSFSFGGYGGWEAGRVGKRVPPRGDKSLLVVLLERRRGGFRNHDCEVLTSAAGVSA